MGTIVYFDQEVKCADTALDTTIELGTTGYAGNGPQLFLAFGDHRIIMSHEDAKQFYVAAEGIANYFGYEDT
ncbi:hypothetical protein JIX59_05960 [Brevundimonas diminuta]|uniref:hypothetical protein n=1 Tax=Brevundimonas diminuta TaxID=293 RepID=UPI001906C0D0|nr:hypothetical protein [Brevundimonas diminuta]MBK1968877.1 hypothetical protein [Brevundimonas diminuta]